MEVRIDKDIIGDPGGRKRVEREITVSRKTKRDALEKQTAVFDDAGCNERGTGEGGIAPQSH